MEKGAERRKICLFLTLSGILISDWIEFAGASLNRLSYNIILESTKALSV